MSSTRGSLLTLGAAAFLVSADARVIDPLLKIIAGEFDVSPASAALTVTAYALPYGLCQLFYGPLGDRVGQLKVMATVMTLFAFGTMACAAVPNLWTFVLLRLLTGAVAAAIIPLSIAYIGDTFPYETRQSALGRFMGALMLGQVLSATLGGVFAEHLDWRDIFVVFGVAALIVAALLHRDARRFPAVRRERHFSLAAVLEMFRGPSASIVLASVFVEGLFVFGGLAFLATSMLDRFPSLGPSEVGLMLAGYGVGGLFYAATVKKLVPTIGERGILVLGASLLCAAYVLIGLLQAWWLFIPGMVLYGMGFFTMHGTLQTRATEINPKARSTAVSLFAFIFFLGQGLGPIAMGQAIRVAGYGTSFSAAGAGLLALGLWTQVPVRQAAAAETPAQPPTRPRGERPSPLRRLVQPRRGRDESTDRRRRRVPGTWPGFPRAAPQRPRVGPGP
ncbi:MAG: MFS transporter [Vicinamibacterales bacterium]